MDVYGVDGSPALVCLGVESSEPFLLKLLSPVRGPTGQKQNEPRFFFLEGRKGFVGFCHWRWYLSVAVVDDRGGFRRRRRTCC